MMSCILCWWQISCLWSQMTNHVQIFSCWFVTNLQETAVPKEKCTWLENLEIDLLNSVALCKSVELYELAFAPIKPSKFGGHQIKRGQPKFMKTLLFVIRVAILHYSLTQGFHRLAETSIFYWSWLSSDEIILGVEYFENNTLKFLKS
jgi:hypothetical protein